MLKEPRIIGGDNMVVAYWNETENNILVAYYRL